MKTKRFVSVILVFVLVVSLAACAKRHTPTPTATDAPTPTTKPTDTPAPSATTAPTETPTPTEAPATPTPTEEAAPSPTEDPAAPTPTEATADPTPTEKPADPTPTTKPGDPTPTEKPADPTPTTKPGDPTPTVKPADPTPTTKPSDPTPTAKPADPTPTATSTPSPVPTSSVQPATKAYVIENADGKTASDLADDWEIKKYDNNWIDSSASIGIDESYSAANKQCFVAHCWNNYSVFRYSHSYSTDKGYSAIEFDVKGDGIANLKIQLMSSTDGVYTTIDLGKPSAKWNHYVVSISDSKWRVKYNGTEYGLNDVLAYMGMSKDFELIPYFDLLNIILSGVTDNGANAHIYFDNLQFTYSENAKSSIKDLNVADRLVMDFEEVNGWGMDYTSTKWTRFKYVDDAWKQFDTGINDYNSSKVGSKLLGLTTGWNTNFMYRYIGNGNGLGSFDHFSVDLGTYNATQVMKVKLAVVTESGETIYLMGSADSMKELQPNPKMQNFKFDFAKRTAIKEFYFCVFSGDSNGDHLFVDNIKLY